MALLDYDAAAQKVSLYQVIPYASMNTAQKTAAAGTMTFVDMSAATAPDTFKALTFVAPTVVGRNVQAAKFDVRAATSTTELPSLDFTLQFNVAAHQETEFGTATMRSPTTQPS